MPPDRKITVETVCAQGELGEHQIARGSHSLDQMAKLVHLACFALRSVPYFEYIESTANWVDELSREGTHGNWAPRIAFSVEKVG